MLTIDLSPLKPGVHHLTVAPDPSELDLDPAAFREVRVELRIDYDLARAIVNLTVSAVAVLECDRTLEVYTERVDGAHTVAFVSDEMAAGAAIQLDEDDLRPLPPPGRLIDLTKPTRDTLLLALPTRRLSPGAGEREIRMVYGERAQPTDPRWDALRSLRNDS